MSDQLKQMVELHKAADQAMKGFIVWLWPGDALPNSFFGLVRLLVDACPRLEVVKQSVCIEGARRAFARVKNAVGQTRRREADQGGAAGGQGAPPPQDVLRGCSAGRPSYRG